jgi:hypothetical protein
VRIPRKKKKQIPEGFYCYTHTGKTYQIWSEECKTFLPSFGTKSCPFYGSIKLKDISKEDRPNWMSEGYIKKYSETDMPWCRLIRTDVDDRCKSCSIKLGI